MLLTVRLECCKLAVKIETESSPPMYFRWKQEEARILIDNKWLVNLECSNEAKGVVVYATYIVKISIDKKEIKLLSVEGYEYDDGTVYDLDNWEFKVVEDKELFKLKIFKLDDEEDTSEEVAQITISEVK